MSRAEEFKRLHDVAEEFYRRHEQEIEREMEEREAAEIREEMPKLLAGKTKHGPITVWCRNWRVCSEATHCVELACTFKVNRMAIIGGLVKCRQFQITSKSKDWDTARHLFDHGECVGELSGR